ncbi:MAG TPA: metallophosphoesterase [Micromonosporaceae bacterium]|nr:metallophosphoesterase [Micromonosporaceae bacterium]
MVGDGRFAALVASARRRARDAYAAVRRTRQTGDDHDDDHGSGGRVGRRGWRVAGLILAIITVTALGTGIALRLGGHVRQDIGPFSTTFALQPSTAGGTDVQIPPLGSLRVDTHNGPAHLSIRVDSLDESRAKRFLQDPRSVRQASDSALPQLEDGAARLLIQSAAVAVLGSMLLAAVVFRRIGRVAVCGGLALAVVLGSGANALTSFRPQAIEEPTYQGLLANAPAVVGDARTIANQFDAYRVELQGLVANVSRLYSTVSTLPVFQPSPDTIRVLHISDLHLNPAAWSVISTAVSQFHIDLVIDTGDINDWGTPMESSFVDPIGKLGVPYVYIRGNHDSETTARAVARQRNAIVLENNVVTVKGLTIAGIGDPRFTPDKSIENEAPPNSPADPVLASGQILADTISANATPVNIALVHDPASATPLSGTVPLVLAGHLHHRETEFLPPVAGEQKTLMLVEGSTGGAGLRGLQGETPTPLEMSVLYFDTTHTLQAYDEITLGGTGESQVTLDRHVIAFDTPPTAPPLPTPSGSSSSPTDGQ